MTCDDPRLDAVATAIFGAKWNTGNPGLIRYRRTIAEKALKAANVSHEKSVE